MEDIPKPLYKVTVTSFNDTIHFTDFSARSVFTYDTRLGSFSRYDAKLPQGVDKVICAITDESYVVLLQDKVYKLGSGTTTPLTLERPLTNELNTNTSPIFDSGSMYFLSGFSCMKYTLSSGNIEKIN